MSSWVACGKVRYREDIRQGLEVIPQAFAEMLRGGSFGKMLVRVGTAPTRQTRSVVQGSAANGLAGLHVYVTARFKSSRAAAAKAVMLAARSLWPVSSVTAISIGPDMAMQVCPAASP